MYRIEVLCNMERETEKIETLALKILKATHMFDDVELTLKDKPDIQAEDKSWGIEVVRAIDGNIAQIQNIFWDKGKMPHSVPDKIEVDGYEKYDQNGQKYERRMSVRVYGMDEFTLTQRCIDQKLKKLKAGNYDGFSKTGLFVFTGIPKPAKEFFVRILQGYEGPMFDIIFFSDIPHMNAGFHHVAISLWTITKEELE